MARAPKLTQPEMFVVPGLPDDDVNDGQAAAPTPAAKRSPGRPRGSRTDPAKAAARRRAAPKPEPAPEPPAIDYGAPVRMLGALLGAGLVAAGLKADAWAVAQHTPAIAGATHDLALAEPRVAGLLETFAKVGPYGAFVAALLPLGVQLLHNHGVISEDLAVPMGAVSATQLRAALGQEEREMAEENAAAA
jgi:hypothetical protein